MEEKSSPSMLLVSGLLLMCEITFVAHYAAETADRSMYLLLPLFIFYLLIWFREQSPNIGSIHFGGISSAIYLMQFGIITVGNKILTLMHVSVAWVNYIVYLLVLFVPTCFYLLIKNRKLAKIIF